MKTKSEDYQTLEKLCLLLVREELFGREDGPIADAIRDAMEGPLSRLSPEEVKEIEAFSASLEFPLP